MAIVSGPLMSMTASGAFGGALVFGKWKGRPTVHQLVIPANPRSALQEASRNRIRAAGKAQRFSNMTIRKYPGQTLSDQIRITAITPAGYAWNGFLVDKMIGVGGLSYIAAQAAWTALAPAAKTAWDTSAAALDVPIPATYQTIVGGVAGVALTGGNVFFLYVYALFTMALVPVPGATPPVYA